MVSGLGVPQSLEIIASTAADPLGGEFRRVTREVELGFSLSTALEHMVLRNRCEDVRLLVIAINVNQKTGGSLASTIETQALVIRERLKLKGVVHTLTAQARLSAWILALLPVGLGVILSVIAPSYFLPMVRERLGLTMLAGSILSIGFAGYVMMRIVRGVGG